jgi:hypothetical protein
MAIKCVIRHVTGSDPLLTRRSIIDNTSITELLLPASATPLTPQRHRDMHIQPHMVKWPWKLRRFNDCHHLTQE